MSKIFYDHLLELEKIDKQIKKIAKSKEEREEIWSIVDEIIHHKAIGCVLDKLPREHHDEFLTIFHKNPGDGDYILSYLKEKVGENVEEILKLELGNLAFELLQEISPSHK